MQTISRAGLIASGELNVPYYGRVASFRCRWGIQDAVGKWHTGIYPEPNLRLMLRPQEDWARHEQ